MRNDKDDSTTRAIKIPTEEKMLPEINLQNITNVCKDA